MRARRSPVSPGDRRPSAAPALAALLAFAAAAAGVPATVSAQAARPLPADSDAAAAHGPAPEPAAGASAPDPASARERVADAADEPSLDVRLDPGPHTVGDRVEAVLTLRAPGGSGEPVFPEWDGAWGEAEVMAAQPVERVVEPGGTDPGVEPGAEPRTVYRQRLELAAFRPGEIALPPVEVILPQSPAVDGDDETAVLVTPPGLILAIESVLPAGGDAGAEATQPEPMLPEPMPPAPPRPLPLGERFLWTLAIGLAACLAAIAFAVHRARAAAATAAGAAALPPFEELRAAVAAARADSSPAAGHTRLSLALRRYLGRALGFPAAESTTAEIRRRLAARRLPGDLPRRTVALLAACDLVKFARRPATAGELAGHADAALGLATDLEVHLHPPETESAGASFGPGGGAPGSGPPGSGPRREAA